MKRLLKDQFSKFILHTFLKVCTLFTFIDKSTFLKLQEESTNFTRREESGEMATMAGMAMVDPCFNGTLSISKSGHFSEPHYQVFHPISGLVSLTPQHCFTGLT